MRPYPKAGPRKGSSTGRKRTTAILTDTPVKAQLEKEKMATDAKKNKLAKVRRKLNPTPVKKILPRPSSSAQNGLTDSFFCIMCQESFSESRPGEKWVQCVKCLLWAHENCVTKSKRFLCFDCS